MQLLVHLCFVYYGTSITYVPSDMHHLVTYLASGLGSGHGAKCIAMSVSVCVSVCLSTRIYLAYRENRMQGHREFPFGNSREWQVEYKLWDWERRSHWYKNVYGNGVPARSSSTTPLTKTRAGVLIIGLWATVCKTVRSMLSDRCLSVRPVCYLCNVGVLWPNSWMDQDETW